jgi:methionine synthase I (cobalamin-dependent)
MIFGIISFVYVVRNKILRLFIMDEIIIVGTGGKGKSIYNDENGKFDFKKYHELNKDKIKERNDKYRETNRDVIREKNKIYYEAKKDEINARRREKYAQAKDLLYS